MKRASMTIITHKNHLSTSGGDDCIDITRDVQEVVEKSGIDEGLVTISVPGSTAGITTIEYETGAVRDLKEAVRRLIPDHIRYAHHETAGDDNGHSHVRAAVIGPSISIPVLDRTLQLGTWQQIILVDFDTHPRSRSYIVQIIGKNGD